MKYQLIFAFILLTFSKSYSQNPIITDTSYTATNGMIFIKGKDIKIGQGSNSDKSFIYIYTSPNSLTPFIKLGASWAGFNFRIKDIKKSGTPKRGYKYYIVCGGGNIANYWIDIEEAIPTGEVYVPNEFKPKPQTNSTGLADELLKLKKLLDDSLLTKEEFDIQKKKLLDQ